MSDAPLSSEAVTHVAKLARLALSPQQVETFRRQLAGVLGHVAKLNQVSVEGVEPMAHPFPSVNALADDVPQPAMPLQDLLMNAPAVEGRYLAVPKVLADGD